MVYIKHLSIFSALVYLATSTVSARRLCVIESFQSQKKLSVIGSESKIIAAPSSPSEPGSDTTLFEYIPNQRNNFVLRWNKTPDLYISCPSQDVPCNLNYAATEFSLLTTSTSTYKIADQNGLILTVGKIDQGSVTLEKDDPSLDQNLMILTIST